jgi:hypothetical protein
MFVPNFRRVGVPEEKNLQLLIDPDYREAFIET